MTIRDRLVAFKADVVCWALRAEFPRERLSRRAVEELIAGGTQLEEVFAQFRLDLERSGSRRALWDTLAPSSMATRLSGFLRKIAGWFGNARRRPEGC